MQSCDNKNSKFLSVYPNSMKKRMSKNWKMKKNTK